MNEAGQGGARDTLRAHQLHWVIASTALNSVFAMLTFGSSVFVLFLSELGLPKSRIGFMLSLFPFCGIVAPVLAPLITRFGLKRTFLLFYALRKMVMLFLLLTPGILAGFGYQAAYTYTAGVILLFALCRAIAESGYYPWYQQFVPDSLRGRYGGVSNVMATLGSVAAIGVASLVMSHGTGLGRYTALIALGSLVGLGSVALMLPVPGGEPAAASLDWRQQVKDVRGTFRNRPFACFLMSNLAAGLGFAAFSFLPLFAKERVGLTAAQVVLLDGMGMIGGVSSSFYWGWATDRYGGKPLTLLSLGGCALIPLVWLTVPAAGRFAFPFALALAFVHGANMMANVIGSYAWFFSQVVPRERSTVYTSVWYAWSGIWVGFGPLLAGWILDTVRNLDLHVLGSTVSEFAVLFPICGILFGVSVLVLRKVPGVGHQRTRDFIRALVWSDVPRAMVAVSTYVLSLGQLREKGTRPSGDESA